MPELTDRALRLAVELHHDATFASISFRPSLVQLLDDKRCRAISDVLRNTGTEWEIRQAVPDLHLQLPDAKGLYMFVWRPSLQLRSAQAPHVRDFPWVLYVGQAGAGGSNSTLRRRYQREYSQLLTGDPNDIFSAEAPIDREERIRRYLRVRPLEFWWIEIPGGKNILQLEKNLIGMLQPPLNNQHNHGKISIRPGKPAKAFEEI